VDVQEECELLAILAGRLAEEKYSGYDRRVSGTQDRKAYRTNPSFFAELWRAHERGNTTVSEIRIRKRTLDGYLAFARALAQDLLDVYGVWQAVKAVAGALIEKRKLDGNDLGAVLSPRLAKPLQPLTRISDLLFRRIVLDAEGT
jgi:hypothetical protein